MIYKIEFCYDGVNYVDISSSVIRDSVEILEALYNENSLEPNINNASFQIKDGDSFLTYLQSNIDIICRISLDNTPVFTGIVSPSCRTDVTYSGVLPITIRAEDYTIPKLKRRFSQDVEYIENAVCDPNTPANSIIHKIANLAGVVVDDSTAPSILSTEYRFQASVKDTYYERLYKLLFEFGYIFYFNGSGELAFYNLASTPSDLGTITNELRNIADDPNSNIVNQLSTTITRGAKDKIAITWQKREKLIDREVYRDDAHGSRSGRYWAYRAIDSQATFPPTSNKDDIVYTKYSCSEGEILYVTDATMSYILVGQPYLYLYKPFVNHGDTCEFTFFNSYNGGYPRYICNLLVRGDVWVSKGTDTASVELHNDIVEEYSYECQYIYTKELADNFLKILKNYFAYSATTYQASSYTYFPIGSYVKVVDTIHQGFTGYGRIRQIAWNKNGSYTYFIEGITAYVDTVTSTVTSEYTSYPGYITPEKLAEGTLPVTTDELDAGGGVLTNVDHESGTVAGLYVAQDRIYVGAGNYANADTGFYADKFGSFSLSDKLSYNGTALTVNGSGTFSGSITAQSGYIGGAVIGTDYVQSTNYVQGSTGWKLSNANGSAEFNNITIRGALYGTSGTLSNLTITGTITVGTGGSIVGTGYNFGPTSSTIGGYSVTANTLSATNLTLTSGAANTANITVGTGSTAAGLNSASTGTDIAIWAGSTFANRASATFRVTAAGALTATGVSITGAITATSGSFTGTITTSNITATGGTIAGLTLSSSTLSGTNFIISNTGDITLGTSNDVVRLSSSDATYRLWIGNATAASATFRVTKAGVLTATGVSISGAITATSGSFTGTVTTSNITATGGTIAGLTLSSSTLSGTNFTISNTGDITLGTSNDVVRLSSSDAGYSLWVGNAVAASAPFRVSKAGVLTATGVSISGAITATSGSFTGMVSTTNITATGGTVGGFTLASATITGGSLVLTNTGNITAGTGNSVVRISANDATYRLWIGNATAASAPFRVSAAGVLTATGATISGAITATSGSFTGTITTANITATGGTVGGVVVTSTEMKSSNYVAGSDGFLINNTGFAEFNNINVRGNVNSTSGSVGGWLMTTDKLTSSATGGRLTLDQGQVRVSIYDSLGVEKVVMGYLAGLEKNSGIGTYGSSDYGFWVKPGDTVNVDGPMKILNGDMTASDASFKVLSGDVETIRLGSDTAVVGLHLYHTNGKVSIYNSGTDSAEIKTDSGYVRIGAENTSWAHVNTDRANFYFGKGIHTAGSLTIYNTGYGIDSTGKGKFLSGTGTDSNTVYIKDSNNQLKERAIPAVAWTNTQAVNTTSNVTFGTVTATSLTVATSYGIDSTGKGEFLSGTGIDSNTVYIKDSNGQLKERTIPAVAWTNTQAVNTTSNVQFGTITGTSLTVATSYGIDSTGKFKPLSGVGTDSNTVYTKDSNGQLKERTIQTGVWSYNYNQALTTTSNVTFGTITGTSLTIATSYGIDSTGKGEFLSGTGTDSDTVYIKDSNGQLKERTIPAVAWTNTQAVNTTSNVQFGTITGTSLTIATSYGIDSTGKFKPLSGIGTDSNTVYTKDSNGQLKERTIQSGVWSYNYNQALTTTSNVQFASVISPTIKGTSALVSIYPTSGNTTDYHKFDNGTGANGSTAKYTQTAGTTDFWIATQNSNTTDELGTTVVYNQAYGNVWGLQFNTSPKDSATTGYSGAGFNFSARTYSSGLLTSGNLFKVQNNTTDKFVIDYAGNTTIAGTLKVSSGSGADSNTVYIKDGSGALKERAIPSVAWTNTQATNTSSDVTFGSVTAGNIRIPTSQPATLANGDIWMV